jgi:hypothetical protein
MRAIEKISKRAKQLQKKKPNAQWKNLIKEASREYNNGKLGSAKSPAKKVSGMRSKKKYAVESQMNSRAGAGLTIAAAKHFIKAELERKLGVKEVALFNATTKTAKKNIRKDIAEIKKSLIKLKK